MTTEMESLDRDLTSQVTIEQWLPEWDEKLSGLTAAKNEQYAHGHAVAVYDQIPGSSGSSGLFSLLQRISSPGGASETESIIFRARSGSRADPQDGHLYIAIIADTDLDDPTTWDTLWVDISVTSIGFINIMHPAWSADSGVAYGGSIAVAVWNNSGTPYGRVFYIRSNYYLYHIDINLSTGSVGIPTAIAYLGSAQQLASMQIACCKYDEVFVTINSQVEAGLAAWHNDIYGTHLRRFYFSGGWQTDDSFPFHTCAEGGVLRDTPDEGNDFSATSCDGLTTQWGKRPCGGLAINNIDDNTVVVSIGLTWWRRWGYDTHAQGLTSFIYYRDSGLWQRGFESGRADFNEDGRLDYDVFSRGFSIEGRQFVAWSRYSEPSDYIQAETAQTIPRTRETVFARLSPDGKFLTDYIYLGNPDDLTAPAIIAVNHNGSKKLYAIGWYAIYESEPSAVLCNCSDYVQDMDLYIDSWNMRRDNNRSMSLSLSVLDPSILTDTDTIVKSGALVKIYFGTSTELVQVGQGYLDLTTPSLQVSPEGDFSENASVNGRADKLMLDTRAGWGEDGLPQNTMRTPLTTTTELEHVVKHDNNAKWAAVAMEWPDLFYSGVYSDLSGQPAYRLLSFPFAQTGGDLRTELKGTWFKDVLWLGMSPMVDGSIEASMRFGDVYDQSNFSFEHSSGVTIYATITRSNGVITQIDWGTSPGGSQISTATQYACMAGLICHAPEMGKKYAFVLERHSSFSISSHTDDTWTAENFDRADYSSHGTGTNMLYLIVSDYDDGNWVNKSVAGGHTATGLTAGYPADLKMQVLGGTIYCYYRQHSTSTPNQWRYAFSYKAGRFGAGRFGIVGRGHAGLQWDEFKNGVNYLDKCDNKVDFWGIKLSDCVLDSPISESLVRTCWRGFTEVEQVNKVQDSGRTISAGSVYSYYELATNLCIDFKVNIPSNTNEAGVFVRGVGATSPENECIKIGLVAHSTANTAQATVNYYAVKRYITGGAEDTSAREYSPIPIQVYPGVPVPIRVTVRGAIYTIWVAGNYAGHFIDQTELGLYYGLYATGGNAMFSNIVVPELYEIPTYATLSAGQTMEESVRKTLGRRKIKGFFTHDGKLKFSYFSTHDTGPDFEDILTRNNYQRNDRYYSMVEVEGADGARATYTSRVLLAKGRRFHSESNPEIYHREHCYTEAQAICAETAENMAISSFSGPPDIRVEPEDSIEIVVSRHNIAGDHMVNDIVLDYKGGDTPGCSMSITARQSVAL